MTLLKRFRGHVPCAFYIQDYLENGKDGSRVIASDFINIMPGKEVDWAHVMDKTRSMTDNDIAYRNRKCVTFHHFILSPDPDSDISIDALMELAHSWADEFFGYGGNAPFGSGKLGSYEVALIAHDDGTNGIKHVHVVVNNTNLDNGLKLQISNQDNDLLWDRLQEMSLERGLPAFVNAKDYRKLQYKEKREFLKRIKNNTYLTPVEKKALSAGKFSWKQDLRDLIQIARRTATDEQSFMNNLKELGVDVHETMNKVGNTDYVFSHPHNQKRWRCSGYKLGNDIYSRDSLLAAVEFDNVTMHYKRDASIRSYVNAYVLRELLTFGPIEIKSNASLHDVASTLRFVDTNSIVCQKDFDRFIALHSQRANKASIDKTKTKELELVDVAKRAKDTALVCELFADIKDAGQDRFNKHHIKQKLSSTTGNNASGKTSSGGGKQKGKGVSKSKKPKSTKTTPKRKPNKNTSHPKSNTL